MITVLTGPDIFERNKRCRELLNGTSPRRLAAEDGLAAMVESVGQTDLFGESVPVVLQDVFGLPADGQQRLAEHLRGTNQGEQLVIVLLEDVKWSKNGLADFLKSQEQEQFAAPTMASLLRWAERQATERQIAVDKSILPQFIERFGGQKAAMATELDAWQWTGKPLDGQALEQMVPSGEEVAAFALGDAWANRQTKHALLLLRQQWRNQVYAQKILGMLEWQARQLYVVLLVDRLGLNGQNLAEATGMSGYSLTKSSRLAKRWSLEQVGQALLLLAELDKESKSGGGDLEFGLERWVVQTLA
jgi:DNA polymerase III delta subunit